MVEGEGRGWSSVLPQLLHGQQILYISLVELVEGRGRNVHQSTHVLSHLHVQSCKVYMYMYCTHSSKHGVLPLCHLTLWNSFSTL